MGYHTMRITTIWHKLEKLINLIGLEALCGEYHIKCSWDSTLPLVCLLYTPMSPKTHWVTRAARGPVFERLEDEKYRLVAVGLERFYNLGEAEDIQSTFNWEATRAETKHDGSIVKMYFWRDRWLVATNGTPTAQCDAVEGITFEQLFWAAFARSGYETHTFDKDEVHIFELITPHNKIVIDYEGTWAVVPISSRSRKTWLESTPPLNLFAPLTPQEARDYALSRPEIEGIVLRDNHNQRIKIKHPLYVARHAMCNNGRPKWFQLWSNGDLAELVTYFPEYGKEVALINVKIAVDQVLTLELMQKFKGDYIAFALEHGNHSCFHFAVKMLREQSLDFNAQLLRMLPKNWEARYASFGSTEV